MRTAHAEGERRERKDPERLQCARNPRPRLGRSVEEIDVRIGECVRGGAPLQPCVE